MFGSLKTAVFAVSHQEASFEKRQFECSDPHVRSNLEAVLRVFIAGYNLTLQIEDHKFLVQKLMNDFDSHHVGFALEGAGMCYAMFDLLIPHRTSRLRLFTDGAGCQHDYITTVGAGFALARVPWGLRFLNGFTQKLDPMVAWCVFDGYGFHQGIFHHRRFVEDCMSPPVDLPPYARQLFDAGLGRSLWWVKGASPVRIRRAIERFPEARRSEMWHGIGVACSYAGGVDEQNLLELAEQSGTYRSDFLSGLPFAARMRQKGENPSPATNMACRLLLKLTADQAANLILDCYSEILACWQGTASELESTGYALVRQRLTGNFGVAVNTNAVLPRIG